jgi:urease accessory protein
VKLDEGVGGGAGQEARLARAGAGWRAHLVLGLARDARGATRLARTKHEGPLRVQRPFYPEGPSGACHVYILHPPGGVVDGDALALDVELDAGAHGLLTAPGASKLYRARADALGGALVEQTFRLGAGALLEWLPHETIVFDGARARLRTKVELAADATYVGWELLCLGRPACAERFTRGELRTELSLTRAGKLVYLERGRYQGGDKLLSAAWGLAGFPVFGTLVLAAPAAEPSWIEALREQLVVESGRFAATLVSGVLVLRFLGSSTREGRSLFERALAVLRPLYAGKPAVHPRIWST